MGREQIKIDFFGILYVIQINEKDEKKKHGTNIGSSPSKPTARTRPLIHLLQMEGRFSIAECGPDPQEKEDTT